MKNNVYQPMTCPVCGKFFFSELQEGDDVSSLQCSKCGWRYDYEQATNPDLRQGNNAQSVNEYRAWYENVIAENPEYDYSDKHCPPVEPHQCPVCAKHMFKDRDSFDICPVCKRVYEVQNIPQGRWLRIYKKSDAAAYGGIKGWKQIYVMPDAEIYVALEEKWEFLLSDYLRQHDSVLYVLSPDETVAHAIDKASSKVLFSYVLEDSWSPPAKG